MRITIGIVGVLGLGASFSAALAQTPGNAQRGAILLPPQHADAPETVIARGSGDDLPQFPGSTPVRPAQQTWLNGADPNVRPAGAIIPVRQPQIGSDGVQDTGAKTPTGGKIDPRSQVNANTAFRGTTANGAPVYAGPPAYRWYGWGSVTPGANPFAPTGRYPNASANWYTITGATPGAFPVPVMNPLRPPPGTEPPAYVAAPAPRVPVSNYAFTPPPVPVSISNAPPVSEQPRFAPPPENKFPPAPPITTPVTSAPPIPFPVPPRITEIPKVAPAVPAPTPLPVPTFVPPVTTLPIVPVNEPEKEPIGMKEPEPVGPRVAATAPFAVALPTLPRLPDPVGPPSLPALPIVPPVSGEAIGTVVPDAKSQDPAPLPVSVTTTDDQPKWQPGNTKSSTGEWNTSGMAPQSRVPALNWEQSGLHIREEPVARGQVGDNRPDPAATLIRRVCDGRADGVDVRWVGSKKLTVCFECRTAGDGQKLVKDISARPELAPFQIDFCVFVK